MDNGRAGMIFDIQRWSIHDGPGIRVNVFFKGCPLRCEWCSNPESQEVFRELAFFPDKCIACKSCIINCPHHAICWSEIGHNIDYSICRNNCYNTETGFNCISECYAQALKVMGTYTSFEEVIKEILNDRELLKQSGGGVTITGGEPFFQPAFLLNILRESKKNELHTAIETSAMAIWKDIELVLPYTDFLFADIKILDEEKHKRYIGVSNKIIRENLCLINKYTTKHDMSLVIRTPVIPGINDSVEEIDQIASWIKEALSGVKVYQLLPYHRLGRGKYRDIGKEYKLNDLELPTDAHMKELESIVLDKGLSIHYE